MEERQRITPSGDHKVALNALTARVGDELETLARLSTDVQRALSACGVSEGTDAQAIRELQGIDRITQSLEDLGRLMSDISAEIPKDVSLHAETILSRLRLHELIENLDPAHEKNIMPREDDGEIMWL
ncbi:hypothetical protein [Thioclava indica]|uniref:Uncharacterized protein n=1 Tax=Thioclava indica TaxID=1353528 RepID=A0A074JRN5_9RHOB|nr:hypothetical protein [Thioclava indica]KEO60306.1 hypothetical protein DT23_13290 [Thioclava indica]